MASFLFVQPSAEMPSRMVYSTVEIVPIVFPIRLGESVFIGVLKWLSVEQLGVPIEVPERGFGSDFLDCKQLVLKLLRSLPRKEDVRVTLKVDGVSALLYIRPQVVQAFRYVIRQTALVELQLSVLVEPQGIVENQQHLTVFRLDSRNHLPDFGLFHQEHRAPPSGIEPESTAPQAVMLSITPWGQYAYVSYQT